MIRILVAPKKSKLQWDLDRLCLMGRPRLTQKKLLAWYRREGLDAGRILASHERQMRALEKVLKVFPNAAVIAQEKMSRTAVERADLVLTLGGDNHFQFVSHFMKGGVVAGVNSDPVLSEGSLTGFTPKTLSAASGRILEGRFRVEEWTRLQVTLNGKKLDELALSEVFLGEASRCQMSRYRITAGGWSELQKCSGLLAATGAGSSGWYNAACRVLFARGDRFPKTRKCFRFLATEPYYGRLAKSSFLSGTIGKGKKLKVRSMNDSRGVVVIDTQLEHLFPEGSEAVVTLGAPLRVLRYGAATEKGSAGSSNRNCKSW